MGEAYEAREFVPRDYFRRAEMGEIFEREAPTELDLGCGDGGFFLAMAREFPERNFLAVERLLGRVRKVCRKAGRANLENVRVLRLENAYAVKWLLPREAFSRIHLLFPDPWPKKKHQKRRFVTEGFSRSIRDLLVPGGEFLFKTDHEDYFEEARERLEASGCFEFLDWEDSDFFYPETDFEKLWKSEGKSIHRLRMVRV